jgi:hypothetical protein
MVVALDLERAGPAVANVNDAGIFARPLDHAIALWSAVFNALADARLEDL